MTVIHPRAGNRISAAGSAAQAGLGLSELVGIIIAVVIAIALVVLVCLCMKGQGDSENEEKSATREVKERYAKVRAGEDAGRDMPYYSQYGWVAPPAAAGAQEAGRDDGRERPRSMRETETPSSPTQPSPRPASPHPFKQQPTRREEREGSQEEVRGLLAPQATWTPVRRDVYY